LASLVGREFERPSQWLTRGEVATLYHGARVVVLPSIYEPFGMTALEALACQRPVVASKTGGLPEIVEHNVNGFLTEPKDELDLAQWLMKLLSDAELRNRLGREGRARVSREFAWGPIAEQFVRLYRDIGMNENGRVPREAMTFKEQIEKAVYRTYPSLQSELYSVFKEMPAP
jgi:glycogen synthase